MTDVDPTGGSPAPELAARLASAVVTTSQMITDSYPDHLCREAVDRRRLDKLGEEFGEVVDAYGGWVGENPRKGQTNGLDKVLDELLDVAACALGAYEHLTGFQADSVPALVEQTERKCERLRAAIGGDPTPGQPVEWVTDAAERRGCTRKGCGRPLSDHEFGVFCP